MPPTNASPIASVNKNIIIFTSLPLFLCYGQAYDGTAVMQGKWTGVATRAQEKKSSPSSPLPGPLFEHLSTRYWQKDSGKL